MEGVVRWCVLGQGGVAGEERRGNDCERLVKRNWRSAEQKIRGLSCLFLESGMRVK